MPLLDRIVVEWVTEDRWRVEKTARFFSRKYDALFFVPEGFESDGPTGVDDNALMAASLFHDLFYRAPLNMPDGTLMTRAIADDIFLEILADGEVSWWKRTASYLAVRLLGWRFWQKG